METNYSFRKGNEKDVPVLLQLVKELADYEKLGEQVVSDEETYLTSFQYFQSLLVETFDEAIGFAIYFYTFSTFTGRPTLYLEDVYIKEEHRGKGLGKKIFQHLAQTALQNNCADMEWMVLNWNVSSIKFYESIGAKLRPDLLVCEMTEDNLRILANN